jgi:uncharacterized protein YdeI (YjbR/CyaY-like superfamily)
VVARPGLDALPRVEVRSSDDLDAWLAANGSDSGSVWLVTFKKGRGPHLAYADMVDMLPAHGWIDSLPRALDVDRTMHLASPRKPRSAWSAINKAKVARLAAEGRMRPAGLAAVERAKADGSWAALDGVETLEPPPDLAAALAATPEAERYFAHFPPSSRRGILEWISAAKTAATRAKRIADTVAKAAENRKANHPAGRDAGPRSSGDVHGE